MTTEPDQYDTPWKEAVERYFPEFMAFYFAAAHAQIDWHKGHEFLEQELAAIAQDAELGKRYVDKLVRVTRLSGQEDWIDIRGIPLAPNLPEWRNGGKPRYSQGWTRLPKELGAVPGLVPFGGCMPGISR